MNYFTRGQVLRCKFQHVMPRFGTSLPFYDKDEFVKGEIALVLGVERRFATSVKLTLAYRGTVRVIDAVHYGENIDTWWEEIVAVQT